jgi:hypothetical protein
MPLSSILIISAPSIGGDHQFNPFISIAYYDISQARFCQKQENRLFREKLLHSCLQVSGWDGKTFA